MTGLWAVAGYVWRSLTYASVLVGGAAWIAATDALGWPLPASVAPALAVLVAWCCQGLRRRTRVTSSIDGYEDEEDGRDPHAPAYHLVNRVGASSEA